MFWQFLCQDSRELAHSETLSRISKCCERAPAFGVRSRNCGTAFQITRGSPTTWSRRNRCRDLLAAPPAIASTVIGRLLLALPRNRKRRSGVSGRHVSVDRADRVSEPDCYSHLPVADLLRKSAPAWRDIPLEHPAPVQPKNDFWAATPSEFGGLHA